MPTRAPSLCAFPGCRTRLATGVLCPAHKAKAQRPTAAQRGYDADWVHFRAWLLEREPLCRACRWEGVVKPAEEVHHDRPIATHPELRLEPSNTIPLCSEHHRSIEAERRRTGRKTA